MSGRPAEPAQCAIYTAALNYVDSVERALDSPEGYKAVHQYGEIQKQDLLDLVLLTRTEITKEDRSRVMVMITMDAHSRDTIADLVKQEVCDKSQFQWSRQLRQSYDYESKKFVIRNFDANFLYAYEYLGNGGRLVITPLTDRIYCTCCQAYNLKMGCAPGTLNIWFDIWFIHFDLYILILCINIFYMFFIYIFQPVQQAQGKRRRRKVGVITIMFYFYCLDRII